MSRPSPRADDTEALNQLAVEALPVVDLVLLEITPKLPPHVDRAELRSAGLLGLVEASRRFDSSLRVPFDRYARIRVRGAILDALRSGLLNSRRDRQRQRELEDVAEQLTLRLGRPPTDHELAAALATSVNDLPKWRPSPSTAEPLRLDLMGNDTMVDPMDLSPDAQLEEAELIRLMEEAVASLPQPHQALVRRYLLGEERLGDLADELGITCGRASQVCSEAVGALRSYFATQYDGVPLPGADAPGVRMRAAFVQSLLG